MCQPKKWWLGLLPLAILWLLANWFKAPVIEADLAARSTQAIAALGFEKPSANAAGRDVMIGGTGFAVDTTDKAINAVLATNGVRLVGDATTLISEAKPYVWSASRDGNKIALAGHMPNPESRAAVNALAKGSFAGAEVADAMTYARGAPASLAAAAAFGLSEVGLLAKSKAALSDSTLTVSGEATDAKSYDTALALLKSPPPGVTLKAEILPPVIKPYIWSARRDASGLTLEGFVPNEAGRTAVNAAAKAAMPDVKINDQMRLGGGAPGVLGPAAAYSFGALSQLASGSAKLSESTLTIAGDAASVASYEAATAALKNSPQGLLASGSAISPALAAPWLWSASREAGKVTLSGFVRDEVQRARLSAQAASAFPGMAISDLTKIARGAPEGAETALSFAVTQLATLSEGKISLANNLLSVSGRGLEGVTQETFAAKAKAALPAGISVADNTIIALPAPKAEVPKIEAPAALTGFTFDARKTAGTLTLTGNFPDEKVHEELVDAARRRFFAEKVVDQLTQASGAPRNFFAAASSALEQLARLAEGQASVSAGTIKVSGDAFFQTAADQIKANAANALPTGFQIESAINVRVPEGPIAAPACQENFSNILKLGKVLFDTGKASVQKDSFGLLDVLAYTASRCPGTTIEIAGHTDSDGAPEANLDLSKRRAAAVVDYLIKAGISPTGLAAAGYGETRPVAPNDTETGKAQNRRIEFNVK